MITNALKKIDAVGMERSNLSPSSGKGGVRATGFFQRTFAYLLRKEQYEEI